MRPANGGWQSLDSAPRDRFVLLLYMLNGTMQSTVGAYDRNRKCWVTRPPHSSEAIEIHARRWHPLPPLPQIEF
jgi:hypothetical protein